jgi:hypothetical protein
LLIVPFKTKLFYMITLYNNVVAGRAGKKYRCCYYQINSEWIGE